MIDKLSKWTMIYFCLVITLITKLNCLNGLYFKLNLTQNSKHDIQMWNNTCNNSPKLNFNFSQQTIIQQCFSLAQGQCNVVHFILQRLQTNPSNTFVTFQNENYQKLDYTLSAVYLNKNTFRQNTSLQILFIFTSQQNINVQIWVLVPLAYQKEIVLGTQKFVINIPNILPYNLSNPVFTQLDHFQQLIDFTQSNTSRGLSNPFKFLNSRDYGHFFHLQYSFQQKKIIYLFNRFIYQIPRKNLINTDKILNLNTNGNVSYTLTGDKYCFNSQETFKSNIFQSIALWTSWFQIFVFSVFAFWPRDKTQNLWNNRFKQNKWTTWSVYSLLFLENDQFFTRLSRISILFFKGTIHLLILAIFFFTLVQDQGSILIAWTFLPAVIIGQVFGHIMGFFFLSKINKKQVQKIEKQLQKLQFQKKNENDKNEYYQNLEQHILDLQESIYTYYYWYYVILVSVCIISSTISIYLMEQQPWQYHVLGAQYWLASFGICFIVDTFIIDLFLTVLFGKTQFVKSKGFYYDIKLGKAYKRIIQIF